MNSNSKSVITVQMNTVLNLNMPNVIIIRAGMYGTFLSS